MMSIAFSMRAAALAVLLGGVTLCPALAADCAKAVPDGFGNRVDSSTGTTVPGTPSYGAASDQQQAANAGQGAAQERVGSSQNALGNTLDPNTGTTVPGTPSGVASDRQQMASTGQGGTQDRDCK
jgi:hypothetical protein